MFGLGMGELLLIFLIALIFLGPKKLPELAQGLGKGIREFNRARQGLMDEVQQAASEEKKDENKKESAVANSMPQSLKGNENLPSTAQIDDREKAKSQEQSSSRIN